MISKKLHTICCGLLLVVPVTAWSGESNTVDPYALPRDKRPIEGCRQTVLGAHPGEVQRMHSQNTREGFHYRFEIVDRNGFTWSVTCSAATQKVIKDQLIE